MWQLEFVVKKILQSLSAISLTNALHAVIIFMHD